MVNERGINNDREFLDMIVVVSQIIPVVRDGALLVGEFNGNLDPLAEEGLPMLESGYGLAMLMCVCYSINLESQEGAPKDTDPTDWTILISFKFIENCLWSLNSALSFEELVPANNPVKARLVVTRQVMMACEALAALYLGYKATRTEQSDIT
ncbi:hypothetical protein ACIBHX_48790 [Nonomuraea sp. NPDC050536]|uniref:hypothetical protein n=1 Tax=Nonomuraea sp. NPDC050536 TaxID=3364366 RepID=UPI0037C537BA